MDADADISLAQLDASIPDVSRRAELIGVPTPFFAIALIAFAARLYARISKRRLGIDDGFLAAGVVFAVGYYICYTLDIVYGGLGRHQQHLTMPQVSKHAKFSIAIDDLYTWTVTLVKVSLACTLCRIQFQRRWRYSLFALIVLLFAFAVTCSLINWLQCQPLRAYWDFSLPRDRCLGLTFYRDWIYVETIFFMATDIVLAILPIILIVSIQMPFREKVVVCILMGLGICASFAAIPKLIILENIDINIDWTWEAANIDMLAQLEMSLGILAVSNTANKALLDSFLRRLGLLKADRGFDDATTVVNSRLSQTTIDKKALMSLQHGSVTDVQPSPRSPHAQGQSEEQEQHKDSGDEEQISGDVTFKSVLDPDFDLQVKPWYRETEQP